MAHEHIRTTPATPSSAPRGATFGRPPVPAGPLRPARRQLAVAAAVLVLAGCVTVESSRTPRRSALLAEATVLDHLQAGVSSRAWVEQRLGAPDAVIAEADGSDLLRYDAIIEDRTRVSATPLLSWDHSVARTLHLWFRTRDGVVTAYWSSEPLP